MVESYEAEAERVFWLTERFVDEGMDLALAMELALAHRDWHEAHKLIEAGCSPELAARIIQ